MRCQNWRSMRLKPNSGSGILATDPLRVQVSLLALGRIAWCSQGPWRMAWPGALYLTHNRCSVKTAVVWSPDATAVGRGTLVWGWTPLCLFSCHITLHTHPVSPHKLLSSIAAFQIALFHWLPISCISSTLAFRSSCSLSFPWETSCMSSSYPVFCSLALHGDECNTPRFSFVSSFSRAALPLTAYEVGSPKARRGTFLPLMT